MSGCCSLANVAPAAPADEPRRVCYLVNFQAKEVLEQLENHESQSLGPAAKRQKMNGGQQASSTACLISSSNEQLNRVPSANHKRQEQAFVHQEEQVNRMRERLFRLLSKVPIQVETIKSAGRRGAPEQSSSRKTNSASSDHLRDPLVIKYYQERSLNNIIELHFSCSLIKQCAKPTSNNAGSDCERRLAGATITKPLSGSTTTTKIIINNNNNISNQTGWQQTQRRDKYQTTKQARLAAEFIGQQQPSKTAPNQTPGPSTVRQQQRQRRASVRQLQQQQQELPAQERHEQQSFSLPTASDMRIAPTSAHILPHLATHYCHTSGPSFNLAPTSEQQDNTSAQAGMLPACGPFDQHQHQQHPYEANNSAPQYTSAAGEPASSYYQQATLDEAGLVGGQPASLYCQAGQNGYTNECQAACAANYMTAAISSSYDGQRAAAYETQPSLLSDANCKTSRLEPAPIDSYQQNGTQLACIVWPHAGYQSQASSGSSTQSASHSPNVQVSISSASQPYSNQQYGQQADGPNFVAYLNPPPSFLAAQPNGANQMIEPQETHSQQLQYGNYFAQQAQRHSHLAGQRSRALIRGSRARLAQLNSESCSASSASSNASSVSLSITSGSPAPLGSSYGTSEARLCNSNQPGELQDQLHRLQPICMPSTCSLDVRPLADAHATVHTR